MTNSITYVSLLIFMSLSLNYIGQEPPADESRFAQISARQVDDEQSETSEKKTPLSSLYVAHTEAVTGQINRFIAESIRYPENELTSQTNGKVYFQFNLDTRGEIIDIKVIRGLNPRFDKVVLHAMKQLRSIDVVEESYTGASYIRVPVHFSTY
jgi:TonB family protein